MKDILYRFISMENPTCIVSRTEAGTTLKYIEVRYIKDEVVYSASSFFTGTWICKNPVDVIREGFEIGKCEKLEDIATVRCLGTYKESQKVRVDLDRIIKLADSVIQQLTRQHARLLFQKYADLISGIEFYYSPVPAFSVMFGKDCYPIGCILVERGSVRIISEFDPIMQEILNGCEEVSQSGRIKNLELGMRT